jgi:hypothetical protein
MQHYINSDEEVALGKLFFDERSFAATTFDRYLISISLLQFKMLLSLTCATVMQ